MDKERSKNINEKKEKHSLNSECTENCTCKNESCHCENESCHCAEEEKEEIKYQTNLEEKVLEYLQTAQRLQAEFDNYRKRATEQIAMAKFDGKIDAVKEFIPALDSFKNAKSMITDEKMLEGFNMIENQILNAFKTIGVEKIEAKGQHFDPTYHNALAVQTNNQLDDGIIIDEYQAGYKLNEKIIRYSQVIVNKKEV